MQLLLRKIMVSLLRNDSLASSLEHISSVSVTIPTLIGNFHGQETNVLYTSGV